jgi:hypothetical protein
LLRKPNFIQGCVTRRSKLAKKILPGIFLSTNFVFQEIRQCGVAFEPTWLQRDACAVRAVRSKRQVDARSLCRKA